MSSSCDSYTSLTRPWDLAHFAEMSPACVCHFGGRSIANDVWQPLERSDIGDHAHLGLTDREDAVGRGQPDITCGYQVDSCTEAIAVDGSDHRFG